MISRFTAHPLWLAGFRPFFILASLMGLILPVLWGFVFSGTLRLPDGVNAFQWHVHEMFFGFGGAVLIGFLLTASKNWVHVRGIHGITLILATFLWILERGVYYLSPTSNPLIKHVLLSLFIVYSGGYIAWTLIHFRKSDSFKDNYFFVFLLFFIVLSKNLLLTQDYYLHGVGMTLGLFRLAFAVMFERTMRQFMKSTENVNLQKSDTFDTIIKISVASNVFQSYFPPSVAITLLALSGVLLFVRWILWKPLIGYKKFGNAVMYTGYLGLCVHFFFETLKYANIWSLGAYSIHIFTFLCMGLIIPSMLIRISKGHTGRKPEFLVLDKAPIYFIGAAAIFRLVLPLLAPEKYPLWILLSGLLWSSAFAVLIARITPFLLRPRIDGKVH